MPKVKRSIQDTTPPVTETPSPFNLWIEPWITLERFTGETEQHGIAFTECVKYCETP